MAGHSKKARDTNARILLIDECGLLLAPLVRRTLAPRGRTPLLRPRAKWREKVSAIAALGVSPKRSRLSLYFRTYPRQYINNHKVVGFLRDLLRQVRGNLIVVWDGGNMHKGEPIHDLLKRTNRLHLERLPAYAPELNPAEYLWKHVKLDKMANFCPTAVEEIDRVARRHIRDAAANQETLRVFVRQSTLPGLLRHSQSEDQ